MTTLATPTRFEAALAVIVPEAEALVEAFRSQHDPSAAWGVPAHITINYPFQPAATGDLESVARELQALFRRFPRFSFALRRAEKFPGVLYLAPEPAERFKDLIQAVARRYPDSPPYGGAIPLPDVTPHLTVADVEDPAQLEPIAAAFSTAAQGRLPIEAEAREVWLLDNSAGAWRKRAAFALSDLF